LKYAPTQTFTLSFRAVQDVVPSESGVYTVYTPRHWVYVGESDDIRQSLFRHLNHPDACWAAERGPLSFSFEAATPTAREGRRRALVAELAPTCR
jgi:hypothetical protein